MKKCGITLSVLLLTLCLLLSGCGKSDKDKFVGTWRADVDMTDLINESLAEDPETAEYFTVDNFGMTLLFTFEEDGSYKITADEDAFAKSCDSLIETITEGATKYLEDMAKAEGLDMTADEMLGIMGLSMDDFMGEMMDRDDLKELLADVEDSGKYEVKDGKLYTTLDENDYIAYKFVSDTELQFTEMGGEDASDEELQALLPLTLTKQE